MAVRPEYEIVTYPKTLPFHVHMGYRDEFYDKTGQPKYVLDHWHPEIEVSVSFSHTGSKYFVNGIPYTSDGDVVLVADSRNVHKCIPAVSHDDIPDLITIVLLINPEFVQNLIPEYGEKHFSPVIHTDIDAVKGLILRIAELNENTSLPERFRSLEMIGLLCQILGYLVRDGLTERNDQIPQKTLENQYLLRHVVTYVEKNYQDPIRLKDVYGETYGSDEAFSRFFRRETGMTFHEYLTKYRLNKAREMILNTDHAILDVALDCGFSDSRGLIQAFKKYLGITPLQYRKVNN